MLLLCLCVLSAHIAVGSSFIFPESLCYGATYTLPIYFTPIRYNKTITYTPQVGDPKIVVNHGQSLDSRFKVSRTKIQMSYISERDNEATISTTERLFNSVTLRVKNCRSVVKKLCGSFIYWKIPYNAEYLEFSGPDVLAPPTILWNRTSQSSIRGKVSGSDFEIKDLTQKDSGYYRFRGSEDQLLKWEQYVVEEHVRSYTFDEGEIKLQYPIVFTPAQVKFKREWGNNAKTISASDGRYKITNRYLAIDYATPEDTGTYDFLDKEGNRILHITLEVREVEKVWVSVVILAAICCGFTLCCCCLKKYCCNESSDKTNSPESETEAAAPSNHNHGTQTTEPVTPLLIREPRVVFPDPPTYNEAGGYTDPPPPYEECDTQPAPPVPAYSGQTDTRSVPDEPALSSSEPTNIDVATDAVIADVIPPDQSFEINPQVSAEGAAEATSFIVNTDSDPHFELSATVLPSAPPLNSDGSNSVQYNSDKLNFC